MPLKNIKDENLKFKLILGVLYLIIVFAFLYIVFSNFDYKEITSYKFIQENRDLIIDYKENNLIYICLLTIIFTIFWVLMLGFGSPIALFAGFVFGKWLGAIIVISSLTIGATILYLISNYFFSSIIKKGLLARYENINLKFRNNELLMFIIFRLIGAIPFGIANILPILFKVKLKNYFLGTLIGITPMVFILVSFGYGLQKTINENKEIPSILSIITSPDIYLPISGFIILLVISFSAKKYFDKI